MLFKDCSNLNYDYLQTINRQLEREAYTSVNYDFISRLRDSSALSDTSCRHSSAVGGEAVGGEAGGDMGTDIERGIFEKSTMESTSLMPVDILDERLSCLSDVSRGNCLY